MGFYIKISYILFVGFIASNRSCLATARKKVIGLTN